MEVEKHIHAMGKIDANLAATLGFACALYSFGRLDLLRQLAEIADKLTDKAMRECVELKQSEEFPDFIKE